MPGILWGSDLARLTASVRRVCERFGWVSPIRFVEIGIADGGTARSIIDEVRKIELFNSFHYYGVDPGVHDPEIGSDFTFIKEMSHKAIHRIPSKIHWCFVDGCHCAQCVEADFILYSARLALGGEIAFHDASPRMQGRDPQLYPFMEDIHDVAEATKGIAVRQVLDAIMPARCGFHLIQSAPQDQEYGGVEIYQKVRHAH